MVYQKNYLFDACHSAHVCSRRDKFVITLWTFFARMFARRDLD